MADVADDERKLGKPLPAAAEAGPAGGASDAGQHALRVRQGLEAGHLLEDVNGGEHGAEVLFLDIGLQVHLLEDVLPAVP